MQSGSGCVRRAGFELSTPDRFRSCDSSAELDYYFLLGAIFESYLLGRHSHECPDAEKVNIVSR
jgi:hypothetical protein